MSSGGDDVTILKRIIGFLSGNEAARTWSPWELHNPKPDMGHVTHKNGATAVRNFSETLVVPIPRIGTSTTDDELRLENVNTMLQIIVVYESSLRTDLSC